MTPKELFQMRDSNYQDKTFWIKILKKNRWMKVSMINYMIVNTVINIISEAIFKFKEFKDRSKNCKLKLQG